jgi:cytochrome c oxidase subunit 2
MKFSGNDAMQALPGLHIMLLILCALIFAGVVGVMFWSIFAHRRMKHHAVPHFHRKPAVEVIWTIVPLVIVLLMALPATRTILAMKGIAHADMTVNVTSERHAWHYEYTQGEGAGIRFLSAGIALRGDEVDHPLVVPVDRKIHIVTPPPDNDHAAQAWAMPAFSVRHDGASGFTRDAWFRAQKVGTWRGFCPQTHCDATPAPVVVQVLSAHDYTQWVAAQKKTSQKSPAVQDR